MYGFIIIYTTKDHSTYKEISRTLREACNYCTELKKRDDVVSGHVYDPLSKKSYCSFDKEDV